MASPREAMMNTSEPQIMRTGLVPHAHLRRSVVRCRIAHSAAQLAELFADALKAPRAKRGVDLQSSKVFILIHGIQPMRNDETRPKKWRFVPRLVAVVLGRCTYTAKNALVRDGSTSVAAASNCMRGVLLADRWQ